jgi:hypothetical protein
MIMKNKLISSFLVLLIGFEVQSQISLTATTGTTTGSYTNISAAFAAINAGTHTGSIVINITSDITAEPFLPTSLRESGFGAASYSDVLIRPLGNRNVTGAFGLNSNEARLTRLFFQPLLVLWALYAGDVFRGFSRTK